MKKSIILYYTILSFSFYFLKAQNNDHPDRIELTATISKDQPVNTQVVALDNNDPLSAMDNAFNTYHQVIEETSTNLSARRLTISNSSSDYQGITEGKASVSLSGGFTYNISIAVPPGVKGAQPNLSLTYNGQGGSGLAGYGWNISGLSTMARVPSDKYHNGFIGPVHLGDYDELALDGQRLIRTPGTREYKTENFSNIKISRNVLSDPTVYYPDGSVGSYWNFGR